MTSIDPLSSSAALSQLSTLGSSSALPVTDPARLPASVRNAPPAAQKAYQTALGFEQVLVNQLTTELTSTAGLSGDDSSDGSDSSDGDDSSSDPAAAQYAQFLPGALSSAIMSNGGLGIAQSLVTSIDPSFNSQVAAGNAAAAKAAAPTTSAAGSNPGLSA